MQLTLWTYEGPPHVGAMRIATSMQGVHFVLHAPQGDTYADLLFTMIERRDQRPPVTYTTFQARDLGGDTADLLKRSVREAFERHAPDVMLVGESCTAELLQDQAGPLAVSMGLPVPVVPLDLPAYGKKENWGAAETFYRLVRSVLTASGAAPRPAGDRPATAARRPRANLLGPTLLGMRDRDNVIEIGRLLAELGVDVNVTAPLNATAADLARLPEADFNVDLCPEIARPTVQWLETAFGQRFTRTIPMGIGATRAFIAEVGELAGVDVSALLAREQPGVTAAAASRSRLAWYSRSVDATYLTGKRVFVFGDATHAIAAARVAADEMGLTVVGLGTYSREFAREVRAAAKQYDLDALITDDYLEVEKAIADSAPELVLGTQMERHIAKRLGIACAVISAPIHVQDAPARYSPLYGFEGANVLFDTWVHPLVMGLEEHLLQMFRDDFEFNDAAPASHLPAVAANAAATMNASAATASAVANAEAVAVATGVADAAASAGASLPANGAPPPWTPEGEAELRKIPFFVRSKARRNTERYAVLRGLSTITLDTLYEAKAHFGR